MTERRVFAAGELLLVDFDPIRSTEQAGIRPALVISSIVMHEVSKRVIVCPVTRNMTPWPTKVRLPESCRSKGMVLADQVMTLDIDSRYPRHIETVPESTVTLVRSYVGRLLDLEVRLN